MAGHCEGGQCHNGPWTQAAASWIRNNLQICKLFFTLLADLEAHLSLAIPVIVVASLLILAILYSCIRACCRRKQRNTTAPSAAYANRKKSKRSRAAAIVPGMAARQSPAHSPIYAPPPTHPDSTYNNSQASLMRDAQSPANRNSVPGAPSLPPPQNNNSPGFVLPPSAAYQCQSYPAALQTNQQSYNPPSGPPPSHSHTGWNANVADGQSRPLPTPPSYNNGNASQQRNSNSNWVDASQYNGQGRPLT